MDWFGRTSLLVVVLGGLLSILGACTPTPEEPATSSNTDSVAETDTAAQRADARSLLARQHRRWRSSSIADYRFTYVHNVAQSPSSESAVIVTVRNGNIVSATYKSAPEIVKVEPEKRKHLPTIDSLFAFIQQSAQEGVDSLRVRYDAEAGFPYSIFLDRSAKKTSDEVTIEVKDFKPLPPKERP